MIDKFILTNVFIVSTIFCLQHAAQFGNLKKVLNFPLVTLWHRLCGSCPETPEYSVTWNIWHNMPKLSVCRCHPSATEMNGNADGYLYPGITDSYCFRCVVVCFTLCHQYDSFIGKSRTIRTITDENLQFSFQMLLWKIIILIYWLRGIWEWNKSHVQEVEKPLMKVKSGRSPWAAFHITCFTSYPSRHWKWTVNGLFLEKLEVLWKIRNWHHVYNFWFTFFFAQMVLFFNSG